MENSFFTFKSSDTSEVLQILGKRLPKSCFIYNAAKMSYRFPEQTSIFVLDGNIIDETSWIIITHFTENYGITISISADEKKSKFSKSEITKVLSESNVIKWDEPHWFIGLEKWIADIIYEISVDLKGNTVRVNPDILFYMEPEECLRIDTRTEDGFEFIKLQKLDISLGLDFILKTWKYAINGSQEVIRRIIQSNESCGVFVDGKPVSSVITHGYGLLSMLYTLKGHRNKGYAKLCMKFVFQDLARNGMVPASSVERSNLESLNFHKKLGCKTAGPVYWIYFSGPEKQD